MTTPIDHNERFFSDVIETNKGTDVNYAPYLLTLLKELDWSGDARTLRDALPYTEEQAPLALTDFLNVMASLGYSPQYSNTRLSDISKESLPCLFIPNKEKYEPKIITEISDCSVMGSAFSFTNDEIVHDIIPDKTIAASDKAWFSKLLYRFKSIFQQVFLASLFINILTLVTPLFVMSVYDKVIGAHSGETLNYLVVGVVLAIGVEFCLRFLRAKSLTWFGARIDYIISNSVLEKLMSLPASFTEHANVAAQLSRIKSFESVREFFTGSLFLSFVELPFTFILLGAIALIAGPLVFIPIIIAAIYLTMLFIMHGHLKALTLRLATANNQRQNINIETLNKQETLRTSSIFNAWLQRYHKVSAESSYAGYLYNQSISFIDTVSQGLVVLGGIAMIYFGVDRIWSDDMSMGAMIAVLILTWRSLAPIQMACVALPRMDQVKNNIDQINRLMNLTSEIDMNITSRKKPNFRGAIEFHNVGLRYNKDADPVYAGLSFKIKPGDCVAITGANSVGKSTTLKLISGLYHPQAGSVRIDGTDIRQIDPISLRQNIAYISQEPEFFSMSLWDNLTLNKPDASEEELLDAINKVGLGDWFQTLDEGLQTKIGHEGNINVPAVLYPQLALVRAYIQNSSIMLIDEMPYEFLSASAGEKFFNFLKEQKGKRTILYITYRQDYIDLADIEIQLYADERSKIKEKDHR